MGYSAVAGGRAQEPLRRSGRAGRRRRQPPARGRAGAHPRGRPRARLALRVRPERSRVRLLRAPRLGGRGRAAGRGALARSGPALRARALMGVLVAVTDHAVERFRQRIGGRAGEVDVRPEIVARVARAWEAGRVDDEPPPGATGARGSVYVRDLVDRSLVFVCRYDRAARRGRRRHAVGGRGRRGAAARGPPVDRQPGDADRAEWYRRRERRNTARRKGRPWPSPRISSSSPTGRSTRPSCWMPSRLRAESGPIHVTMLAPSAYAERAQAQRRLERAAAQPRGGRHRRPRRCSATPTRSSPSRRRGIPAATTRSSSRTLAEGASRWLQIDLPHRVAKLTDCQVRHVVGARAPVRAAAPAAAAGAPADARARRVAHALGDALGRDLSRGQAASSSFRRV